MRLILLILAAIGLVLIGAGAASVTSHDAKTDPGGISTVALSRCAGLAGLEMRKGDAAFAQIMLDGSPWLSAYHDHQAAVVNGTGTLRRRNGTTVPFRFFCALDDNGHASLFRVIPESIGETLPSSRLIAGVAVPIGLKAPLPHGAELRVQLLDTKNDSNGELLAEQVVRSGWGVPISFALRVPADANLQGRRLVISARIVVARAVIYRMENARLLAPDELQRPIVLDLASESAHSGDK